MTAIFQELEDAVFDRLIDIEHAMCTTCETYVPGVPHRTYCGLIVIDFGPLIVDRTPPNACKDCVEIWRQGGCPRCGK